MSWNETVKSRNLRKLDAQQCDLSRRQEETTQMIIKNKYVYAIKS